MSLRDEFEKDLRSRHSGVIITKLEDGEYAWSFARDHWATYQSATERALRIVREEADHSYKMIERVISRIKGDSNG